MVNLFGIQRLLGPPFAVARDISRAAPLETPNLARCVLSLRSPFSFHPV